MRAVVPWLAAAARVALGASAAAMLCHGGSLLDLASAVGGLADLYLLTCFLSTSPGYGCYCHAPHYYMLAWELA